MLPIEKIITEASFKAIQKKGLSLCILSSTHNHLTVENLKKIITSIGLQKESIECIGDARNISPHTSHLICFQSQFNVHVLQAIKKYSIALIIIEETLLSLTKKGNETLNIVSQYHYHGHDIYQFLSNTPALKVLIVDDDTMNIHLIQAILKDSFAEIYVAGEGETALEMMTSTRYDLIYLDHHMPKMTGLEVIKAYREIERKRQSKPSFVVSISGNTNEEEKQEKYFDLHLGKPFNTNKIKDSFRQALEVS